jgi:superfamily I DNA and/or RNA helicase
MKKIIISIVFLGAAILAKGQTNPHEGYIITNERLIRWQWYLGAIVIIGLLLIGLWLRKRHHLKTMLAKRQIEIQSLVLQVDHKKNEVAKYENRIAQLQTEQLKDNETKEELKAQIEKLTRQKDEAQSDFLLLSQKMQEWTGAEVEKLRQGILLMANVEEGKCVKNWSDDELKSLINYYCAVHTDFAKTIYKDHQNLSARQCLYLMLVDMKKTEDETSDIMGVAKDSLRSYRFQIKQKANKRQ